MTSKNHNQAKRFAFLVPDMSGGGAERVALALINDLIEHGHEVDLVMLRSRGALLALVPASVRIVDLGVDRFRNAILPVARYLKQAKPDVLHIFLWPLTIVGIIGHRIARSKARLLINDQVALSKQYGHLLLPFGLLKASTRFLYPRADIRVLCSHGAADDLASLSGIDRERFEVIYNPAQPPKTIESTNEIHALWGECDKRIINVGALKAQKNQALLIRSFARLPKSLGAKLMILGEGELRPSLEALAVAEGVADRVIFPGFAMDPWPYFASADIFVLSSDYEGFANVVVEAMYAGLPVVSTDCQSGPREILDGGRYGALAPCGDPDALADAIQAVLADPLPVERMRDRAAQISGPANIERYRSLMLGHDAAGS